MRAFVLFGALGIIASAGTAGSAAERTKLHETVRPLSRDKLPDGHELIAVEVDFPPGVTAAPHRHPAFVYAYVLYGTIISAIDAEAPQTYRAGQSWHEQPGVLHRVTRNPSANQPARLLAVFIANAGESELVRPVTGKNDTGEEPGHGPVHPR